MQASGEKSPDREHNHARKRARIDQESSAVDQRSQAGTHHPRPIETSSVPGSTASIMNPAAMSFEAQIGLALKGSNWQELQSTATQPATMKEKGPVQENGEIKPDVAEGEKDMPKEMSEKQKKKMERFTKVIARDAGNVLQTIDANAIIPVPWNVTWDKDPELLCCYNWQASTDGSNTIFVPGEPAKWTPPTLPHTLERDSGFQYADYNYARQPRDPYSPMFHALSVMNPGYQFNDVDVLADRNNLRVLLEFTQGKANGPFRLDLYLLFNTLVIVRKESSWWKNSDGASYGCNFERFFTRPTKEMEDATSHYRAIRYPMGPLNVVVRFEADAYDDGLVSDVLSESEAKAVSGGLAAKPTFDFRAPIRVLQKGHIVPTAQMVELKTQKYDPERFRPVACQDQLWFGRTSLLFTGPYELGTGVINRVKCENAMERVKNWEESNQESLRKLVALLSELRAVLKRERRPNRAVVLVREEKAGPLSVRSMEGMNHAVGKEFFMKHWRSAPMPPAPQTGGYRGPQAGGYQGPQVGGYRGPQVGGYRGPQTDGNRGVQAGGYHSMQTDGYRGQRGGGRGAFNAPRGRGQFNPPHGRGSSEPRRGPDYRRGASRGQPSA